MLAQRPGHLFRGAQSWAAAAASISHSCRHANAAHAAGPRARSTQSRLRPRTPQSSTSKARRGAQSDHPPIRDCGLPMAARTHAGRITSRKPLIGSSTSCSIHVYAYVWLPADERVIQKGRNIEKRHVTVDAFSNLFRNHEDPKNPHRALHTYAHCPVARRPAGRCTGQDRPAGPIANKVTRSMPTTADTYNTYNHHRRKQPVQQGYGVPLATAASCHGAIAIGPFDLGAIQRLFPPKCTHPPTRTHTHTCQVAHKCKAPHTTLVVVGVAKSCIWHSHAWQLRAPCVEGSTAQSCCNWKMASRKPSLSFPAPKQGIQAYKDRCPGSSSHRPVPQALTWCTQRVSCGAPLITPSLKTRMPGPAFRCPRWRLLQSHPPHLIPRTWLF